MTIINNEDDGRDGTSSASTSPPHPRASSIVFGSCNSQHYEQPFWKVIKKRNPTAFVWTGDAVYADDRLTQPGSDDEEEASITTSAETSSTDDKSRQEENIRWWWPSSMGFCSRSRKFTHATPEYLRQLYQEQLQVPDYQDLLLENNGVGGKLSIFGAIDDHDYGINNGDKTFPFRRESGIEFTKFLGLENESSAMSRRVAKGFGVYGVQVYDFSSNRDPSRRLLSDEEAGLDPDVVSEATYNSDRINNADENNNNNNNNNQLVAIFVLDVRTNKTPWAKSIPERYTLDPEGDFLGDDQWKWFETAIGRSKASVNIVVSGMQVHAPWFYDVNAIENWSGFPKAQHRLYQTILQPNVRAPILFSGDVHLAQFLRKDCRRMVTAATATDGEELMSNSRRIIIRPLYEVTSSGMTHSWGSKASFCGRPNKSRLCYFYPFNVLVEIVMTYAHFASPWTALLQNNDDDSSTNRKSKKKQRQYSLDRNIAEVELDWTQSLVTVRILGDEGQTLLKQDWSMDRLTGTGTGTGTGTTTTEDDTLLSNKSFDIGQQRLESSLQSTLPKDHDEYICVNYRGNIDRVHFAFSVVSTIGIFMIAGMYPILFFFGILTKLILRRRHQGNKKPRKRRRKSTSSVDRPKND